MNHFASPAFWDRYHRLPQHVREFADAQYALLNENPSHPSLHFKKTGRHRSVRIGMHYRALAVDIPEGLLWFWIGSHADYDRVIE